MKDVVFVRQQGGLARTAPGEDHISAFISYGGLGSIPGEETSLVQPIFSLRQAEDLGIRPNDSIRYIPEPNGTVQDSEGMDVPSRPYIHNIWYYHISEFFRINPTGVLWLGLHENKFESTDLTEANGELRTALTEYNTALTEVEDRTEDQIVAAEELAADPENTALQTVLSDADEALQTAIENVESKLTDYSMALDAVDAVEAPVGTLLFDDEIKQIQLASDGRIRQAAVYTTDNFDEGALGTLQGAANSLEIDHMPLSIIYAANFASVEGTDVFDYDVTENSIKSGFNKNVSVVIGQDGGNSGKALFDANGHSISCLGAVLGTVSSANVHESIAWVQEFDVSSSELNVLALADGTLLSTLPKSQQDVIDSNGFIFLKKHIGISGSYFNDSHTATLPTNDFAFIENNRALDKAIRGIRTALLPQLSSPLYVEANGDLSFDTIGYFESLASRPLEQMRIDGEVSDFDVAINPSQNVLSTSKLEIQISVIPVGVARTIEVTIGFALSVA